jgi:hypothetical protein
LTGARATWRARRWKPCCPTEGGADEEEQCEDGKKTGKQEVTVG